MLASLLKARTQHQPLTAGRSLLAVLAFALLFSQGVGLLHRALHAPAPAAATAFQDEHADAPAGAAGNVLADLFPHLVDESTCRLFDAVISPAVAASVHEFTPVQAGTPQVATAVAPAFAPATSHCHARGPPSHS